MQTSLPSYGVKYQARCIANVVADTQRTRFLVGTLSLREENEIHVIQMEKSGALALEALYTHPAEIWDLAACPFDPTVVSTVYASGGEYGAAIWKLPDRSRGPPTSTNVQQLLAFDGHTSRIICTLWFPRGKYNHMVTIDKENLHLWDIGNPARELGRASAGDLVHMSAGCWSPHDLNGVATACGSSVKYWDLRSMKIATSIEQAHATQVLDMDFNPKIQNAMVTSGDDSKIRIWDFRMSGFPVAQLPGHAHWTLRVQYNPHYEELILSGGTDSTVNLWYVPHAERERRSTINSPRAVDPLLRSHHEHEDSVYGISWSTRDPWAFASISYDGNVYVDVVAQAVRKRLPALK